MQNPNAVAIIPARGGSKRIPKKNIKLFHGKPLIAYSIETALDSGLFKKVVISTDDEAIAKIARKYGAEVPFMRSKELSDDFATSGDAVRETLKRLQTMGEEFEYLCTIYATAPLLEVQYLQEGFARLQNSDARMAFSVTSMPFPIQRTFKITKEGRCQMFTPEYFKTRSQDLEEAYQDAGQFYWEKIGVKAKDIAFGSESIPIVLPRYLVQDIDTLEDWKQVELLYETLDNNLYKEWNRLKERLNNKQAIFFNERDILFISMGQNIGFEQYGKGEEFLRPVVVLKKFNKHLFLGVPLSSKVKNGFYFHTIHFKGRENSALLLQSKTFDSKRIQYKLARLSEKEFEVLVEKFCEVVTPTLKKKGSD